MARPRLGDRFRLGVLPWSFGAALAKGQISWALAAEGLPAEIIKSGPERRMARGTAARNAIPGAYPSR